MSAVNSTDPAKEAALDYLISHQDTSGSWQSDPLQTALVLKTFTQVTLTDTDKDGIPDAVEQKLGTNPAVADGRNFILGNDHAVSGVTASVLLSSQNVGQPFSIPLTASGGTTPHTWSIVSGSLPDELILNSATGVISGTPTDMGVFNFTYKVTDANGTSMTVASQIIVEDTALPTGTIAINGGETYTNTTSVTLTLSCSDNASCSQMQFSNDNTNWSAPESYGTTKAWTLVTGDGTKTVYVKFKDVANNWSVVYSDTIVVDTTSPTGTISIRNGRGVLL